MKGLFVDHDLGPIDAFVVPEFARNLDRRFVGFEPGAAEECVLQA
jgi:hypothetical protein